MDSAASSVWGFRASVLMAGVAVAVGALPMLLGFGESSVPTGALFGAGWPALGVAAALLLDRGDRRLGRALAVLALVPTMVLALAGPSGDGAPWVRLERAWQSFGVLFLLVALVAVNVSAGIAPGRLPRRRLTWLLAWSAVLLAAFSVAHTRLDSRGVAVVMTLGMWGLAGLVVRLATATELRPVDEPLADVAAAALPLLIGAVAGVLVRIAGDRAGIPAPDLYAGFAAVTCAALAWPVASWARRSWLQRRYGAGALSSADVAAITADLHHLNDPRDLLGKAADLVRTCSGSRAVTMVLGADMPELPAGWVEEALLVGGERVGSLLLDPGHPEGPEPRQARIVSQLVPTLALVTLAVALAVEAEHSRRDVARQRDAERARILGDLHDGLGPVLVGMGMRVQAELRRSPTPLLRSLEADLRECRGDLRRIVSGLTPSALRDSDLESALERVVATFDGQGQRVTLESAVPRVLSPDITVAIYQSVAEGLTNAVRHGHALNVEVRVGLSESGCVLVDVSDDGVGGPIAPGVGLTSLRRRAEELGGRLVVEPGPGAGVLLHVELPAKGAA